MIIEYTNVPICWGAECDTVEYLVVAKVWKILTVSKQATQKFDGKRFNLSKLNELEVGNNIRLRLQTGLQLWGPKLMVRIYT